MPSLLPDYEYDIFISYRQKDNKYDGWVTEFVSNLKKELEATFKEDISIYFDENPHDGLRETHDVDSSLKEKLKCLIFIPIISQTFCDPKSFAWNDEFLAFLKIAAADSYGLKIRLPNGNTASRALPVRIHELDATDKKLLEAELQGQIRAIDFTFHSAGVNRPLRPKDDEGPRGQSQNTYRDQINKMANAIKELIAGLRGMDASPVPVEDSETKKPVAPAPSEPWPRRKWTFKIPQVIRGLRFNLPFIGATLALAAVTIFHFSEPAPDPRTYRSTILPPEKTFFSTTVGGHIALSPDGHLLAFVARDSAGRQLLWVRPLNAITGQALNGTEEASFPFWSPDSRFIGFFAGGKLKKIEASGGPPQTLCDAAAGRGGAWNDKGTIVFCPAGGTFALSRVSAAGGQPVVITKLDSSRNETSHRWPYFLPDGEHFLFATRTTAGAASEGDAIFLGSLDTTFIPRIVAHSGSSVDYANGHLLFAREQTLMAQPLDTKSLQTTGDAFPIAERVYFESLTGKTSFSVSQNGILAYQSGTGSAGVKILWHDRMGKQTGGLSQSSFYHDLRLSPDGKRVAIAQLDTKSRNTDIWIYEIARAVWTRFTFEATTERWPIWSPDGSTIVFASARGNRRDLFQRVSSGAGGEAPLLLSNLQKIPTDWSRDGRFIAYTTEDPKSSDIWILPMNPKGSGGEPKSFPFLQTEFNEARAAFSPDGRWIAYNSDESGRNEIYIRPFPGPGGKWQVSTSGGSRARWRGDGKELFYLGIDDKIMSAEIKLGASTVDIGTVRPLFQFRPFVGGGRDIYDVTGDGQRFLVTSLGSLESSSPVTLVVNWPGEIKKK